MELKSTANVNKQWKRKSNSYHYSNKSKGRANKLENINAKCSANINTTTSKRSKPCQAYIAVSQCAGVQSSGEKKGMVPDPSH